MAMSLLLAGMMFVSAALIQQTHGSTDLAKNVLYSTAVDKLLLQDLMPMPNTTNINTNDSGTLWFILDKLVILKDIRDKIVNLTTANPTTSYSQHLNGFKIIIDQMITESCEWIDQVVMGGFSCTSLDDSFSSLKTKLKLYNQLNSAQKAMETYIEKKTCNS